MSEMLMEKTRTFLEQGYTCAIVKGDQVLLSKERGIAPLKAWLESGADCAQALAADKVVGKAAAFLYVLLKVKAVYAQVVSHEAEEVLRRFGISCEYERKVPAIRNRDNTGFCPMEQAVWNAENPIDAYRLILLKFEELKT